MAVNYEYKPFGTTDAIYASAQLIPGKKGRIHRVDFYPDTDYLRGSPLSANIIGAATLNFGLDSGSLQTLLERVHLGGDFADEHHKKAERRELYNRFKTLEDLSIEQLKALVNFNRRLGLDELLELRELEQSLRKKRGDYRGRN